MGIIDKEFIRQFITNNQKGKTFEPVKYRWTHGASDYDLGDGLLIYSIIQYMRCKVCGSKDIRKNGIYTSVQGVEYQQYFCKNHGGYAGKLNLNSKKPILRS